MNSSTNLRKPGKFVNAPVMKKDAMALVTGKTGLYGCGGAKGLCWS